MTKDIQAAMLRACARYIDRRLDERLGTARASKSMRMSLALTHVQKFMSGGKRTVRGLASTASVDRHGDIVMPKGGIWRLPLPLLWSHDHTSPIGVVREAVATHEGVRITADIVEGIAKADEVWSLIEAGALDSFSIGFIGLEGEAIPTGTRWTSWELMEISVVAVPSNRDSKIGKSAVGAVKLVTHPDYWREHNAIPGHPGAVRITRT